MADRLFFDSRHSPHWAGEKRIYLESGSLHTPIHHPVAVHYFGSNEGKNVFHVGKNPETAEILVYFLYNLNIEETVRRIILLRNKKKGEILDEIIAFLHSNLNTNGFMKPFARTLVELTTPKILKEEFSNFSIPAFNDALKKMEESNAVATIIGGIMSADPENEFQPKDLQKEGEWNVKRASAGVFDLRFMGPQGMRKIPVLFKNDRYSMTIEGIIGSKLMTLDELLATNGLKLENFVK